MVGPDVGSVVGFNVGSSVGVVGCIVGSSVGVVVTG